MSIGMLRKSLRALLTMLFWLPSGLAVIVPPLGRWLDNLGDDADEMGEDPEP